MAMGSHDYPLGGTVGLATHYKDCLASGWFIRRKWTEGLVALLKDCSASG